MNEASGRLSRLRWAEMVTPEPRFEMKRSDLTGTRGEEQNLAKTREWTVSYSALKRCLFFTK